MYFRSRRSFCCAMISKQLLKNLHRHHYKHPVVDLHGILPLKVPRTGPAAKQLLPQLPVPDLPALVCHRKELVLFFCRKLPELPNKVSFLVSLHNYAPFFSVGLVCSARSFRPLLLAVCREHKASLPFRQSRKFYIFPIKFPKIDPKIYHKGYIKYDR